MMQRHKSRGSHMNPRGGSYHHQSRGGGGSGGGLGGAGLLGNVPRHGPMNQGGGPGLLGGAPHDPFRNNANRDGPPRRGPAVNPWEGGVVPGGGMSGMAQMRGGPGGGGGGGGGGSSLLPGPQMNSSQGSLLGNPQGFGPMSGGMSGAPGLLGGPPNQPPMLGQMGNRDHPPPGLNLMGNMMGPAPRGGPHFGPPPAKMRRMEQRIGSIGARPLRVGGGPHPHHHHHHHHHHQSRPSAGASLPPQDLRRRLADKRLPFTPQNSSNNNKKSSATSSSSSSSSGAEKSIMKAASTTDTGLEKQGSDTASSSVDVVEVGTEEDNKDAESPEELIPVEAIHCHICQLYKFSSKKAFLAHLSGSMHDEIARAFHNNNSAVLQLLRAQAKVVAQRQVIATRVSGDKVKLSQCFKCHCQVAGSLQKHIASVEHRLVNNFQILKCCNVWYSNRLDYEEHRLTLPHQYREYLNKKKKETAEAEKCEEEVTEEDMEEPDLSWATDSALALRRLQKTCAATDPVTTAAVAPYTGDLAIGTSFLSCHGMVRCSLCTANIEVTQLLAHCRSSSHYYNVLKALKEKEEKAGNKSSPTQANGEKDTSATSDDTKEAEGDISETAEGDQNNASSSSMPGDDDAIDVEDGVANGGATAAEDAEDKEVHAEEEEDYDDALEEGDLMPELEFDDGDHPPNDEEPSQALKQEEVKKEDEVPTEDVPETPVVKEIKEQEAVTEESDPQEETQQELKEEIEECEFIPPSDEMLFEDEVVQIPEQMEESQPPSGRGRALVQQSLSPEGTPSRRSARATRKRGADEVTTDEDEVVVMSQSCPKTPSRGRKRDLEDATDEDETVQSPPRAEATPKTPSRGRGRGRGRGAKR